MTTASELTAEQLDSYRVAARRRHEAEQRALARREQLAWELARRAATLLRDEFRADRVVVFGSIIHPGCFTAWSDVDVAAWGLDSRDTLRAMEAVSDLSQEIPVNLVDVAACSASLRSVIEQEGQPL
jgi:predicted nucleotidyltransferase